MAEEKEFEAAGEKEAVREASRQLGIGDEELEYRIVEEGSKGFLGIGGRPTRIVVTLPGPGPEEKGGRLSIGEEVKEFQQKMLDKMQMELHVEVESGEDYIYLRMNGPDKDLILQSRAELLEVFQYLLNRIFVRRLDGKRVLADCDGYRDKKENELKQIAKRVSEKVKQTGVEEELGLMNPYERRIVHLAVSDEEGVSSASRGDGFMKRVTIMPS